MIALRLLLLPLWLAGFSPQAQSARILAVLSIPGKSHHQFMVSVLRPLVNAGHEVVLYSNFKEENTPANFTSILVKSLIPIEEEAAEIYKLQTEKYTGDKCWDKYLGLGWFSELIRDDSIKKLITSKEKFDLVISETYTMQEFNLIFGLIFKAPTISLSAISVTSMTNYNIGNSVSITSLPNLCALRPSNMGFIDRFLNAYYLLRRHYIHYHDHIPALDLEMRRHFKEMPHLMDLIQNVSLVFVNDHQTASFAQPRTPNLIPVAGIHIRPTQPLPQDIQQFMDGAEDGVILFSSGTFVSEQGSLNDFYDILKDVFAPLKQRVLWKTNKIMKDLPPAIFVSDWMPQQGILAHKNCVLFITHGGINSMLETIHHGVPVVVIPHLGDQPNNAMYLVEKEVGVLVKHTELSRETLSAAISKVLHDNSYAERMRALSAVFRDRPMTPEATVVYWTEYVLRHGGAPHLRPTLLPFYKRYLFDVIACLLGTLALIAIIVYLLIRKISKSLSGQRRNKAKLN